MLIPVQRKFTRSTKSRLVGSSKKTVSWMPRISFSVLWIIFGVFILSYGVFLLFKFTLFVPEYTITKVDYALANVQVYDDPYFYKNISTLIKGENYRVVQRNESSLLRQIQSKYPFVQTFSVLYKSPNKVLVKLSFEDPQLVVFHGNLRYAVYDQQFFQLFSGNTLGSGALRVELFPSASSGGSLTGLFYQESFDHFVSDLHTLYEAFPNAKYFVYLVGGQRIMLGLPNDRVIYINLLVSIDKQLENYQYLKQYYTDFSKLKEIDLGSIEMDKVIARK